MAPFRIPSSFAEEEMEWFSPGSHGGSGGHSDDITEDRAGKERGHRILRAVHRNRYYDNRSYQEGSHLCNCISGWVPCWQPVSSV